MTDSTFQRYIYNRDARIKTFPTLLGLSTWPNF